MVSVIDSAIEFLNSLSLSDICIIVLLGIICIFIIVNIDDWFDINTRLWYIYNVNKSLVHIDTKIRVAPLLDFFYCIKMYNML